MKVPGESSTREAVLCRMGFAIPEVPSCRDQSEHTVATETGLVWHSTSGLLPPWMCERKSEVEKEFKIPQKLLARVNYSFFFLISQSF